MLRFKTVTGVRPVGDQFAPLRKGGARRELSPQFAFGDPLRFRRTTGHKDLFYIDDKDLDFKDVIEAPLPKAPLDTSIVCHWLAIEGVQPASLENAPVEGYTSIKSPKLL
ncbi:unnamed protein product [Camellia sinensis]